MKRILAVCLVVLVPAVLLAQSRDFSGRWTIDVSRTAAANPQANGGIPASHDITIAMDSKTITVLSTLRSGLMKRTYNLDGSESKNETAASVGPGGGAPAPVVSTANWQGDTLVVTIKLYSTNATEKYSREGTTLRVEFSNPEMNPATRVIFYKRAQ